MDRSIRFASPFSQRTIIQTNKATTTVDPSTTKKHNYTANNTMTSSVTAMMAKVQTADGFLAALDQSGGSTPKALKAYGVPDDVSTVKVEKTNEAKRLPYTHLFCSIFLTFAFSFPWPGDLCGLILPWYLYDETEIQTRRRKHVRHGARNANPHHYQ